MQHAGRYKDVKAGDKGTVKSLSGPRYIVREWNISHPCNEVVKAAF